jgi:hypothetical protein
MTMSARLFAGLALAAAILAPAASASAQDRSFEDAQADARERTIGGVEPFAGLNQIQVRTGLWSVNSFYVQREPGSNAERRRAPGAPYYVVVRRTGGSDTPAGTQWADSRTCPGVTDMLVATEALPPVRIDAPGLGEEWDFTLTADGVHHVFWTSSARSGFDDTTVSLEIGGNVHSPIALWWKKAEEGLKTCWASTPPGGSAGPR